MTPERWAQITEVFEAALEKKPDERPGFLEEVCGPDEVLRRDVERLLVQPQDSWLKSPVEAEAAPELATGQVLGRYRVEAKLGKGGMGAVYKAHDTMLRRPVALKILPPWRPADPESEQRLIREARAASALNHPNIVTIYDIGRAEGVDFIAMEYVAGRTLDQVIPRKGLRLEEALKYAVQIADSLVAAHGAGIVHRDIKPSNIMVSDHGQVKVLDFGLAKVTRPVEAGEASTQASTTPSMEGIIKGTAAYMSPEQAEGKPVDARSDIFSFGAVMYEMLTGLRVFQRESLALTLAAILKEEPKPLVELIPGLAQGLGRLVGRCLRKEPERRIQTMTELRVWLEELRDELVRSRPGLKLPGRPAYLAAAIVLVVIAAWAGVLLMRRGPGITEQPPQAVPLTSYPGFETYPNFSPDGNQVAFVWEGSKRGNADIYVKQIGTENLLRLTSDPNPDVAPAWSPDGRHIAFWRGSGVYLVPAIGGPERELARDLETCGHLGWHPDGKYVAIAARESGQASCSIYAISLETRERWKMTSPPAGGHDYSPSFSPNGRKLAFVRDLGVGNSAVYLLPVSEQLTAGGGPKQLTFGRDYSGVLGWDREGREIVICSGGGNARREVWRMPISGARRVPRRLASLAPYDGAAVISPQGNRLAFVRPFSDSNIWNIDLSPRGGAAAEPVKFISSTRMDDSPQYSPDGKRVLFISSRSGSREVWMCAADGSGAVQLTFMGVTHMTGAPRWSPDGQQIVFDSTRDGNYDLYLVNVNGGKERILERHPATDALGSWSRDGRWIYFVSDRSKRFEVWKIPAAGGDAVQVTTNGGYMAFESLDGKDLYYAKERVLSSLWRVPTGGGAEMKIADPISGMAFIPGRDGIYFKTPLVDGFAIRFLSYTSGETTTLTTRKRPVSVAEAGLSVSPDERSLLYSEIEQAGSDLMLISDFR